MANIGDPTFDVLFQITNDTKDPYPVRIANGVQLYLGQLVKFTAGDLNKHAAGSGTTCMGVVIEGGIPGSDPNVDGNTTNANGTTNAVAPGNTAAAVGNQPKAIVERGRVTVYNLTLQVAGTLAGSEADKGTLMYAGSGTSNLQDLSTTQTSTDKPIGVIAQYRGAGATGYAVYDVTVFAFTERLQHA